MALQAVLCCPWPPPFPPPEPLPEGDFPVETPQPTSDSTSNELKKKAVGFEQFVVKRSPKPFSPEAGI
jgi:hypothetical protein